MWRSCWAALLVVAVVTPPASGQEMSEHRPVLSTDGHRVVFMRQSPETGGDWELFSVDRGASKATRLTRSPGWDGYAVFSPDGRRIVFDRSTDGSDKAKQPHLLDLEGDAVRPMGSFEGWLSVSDWSEEHGLLAFWERDGQRDLYLLDEDGAVLRRLTDTPDVSEHDAHFSPDGAAIVFASGAADGDGTTALEWMTSSGDGRRVLTESQGRIYGAAWSPNGLQVAYTDAPDGENGDVFLLTVRSGEVSRLTDDEAWDHMPVWTPAGDQILFTSYRSGTERMYWLDPRTGAVEAWVVGS